MGTHIQITRGSYFCLICVLSGPCPQSDYPLRYVIALVCKEQAMSSNQDVVAFSNYNAEVAFQALAGNELFLDPQIGVLKKTEPNVGEVVIPNPGTRLSAGCYFLFNPAELIYSQQH
jgi:hypothetical protein